MANFLGWTDKQIEALLNAVFAGRVNPFDLPPELFEDTLRRLTKAVTDGFGGGIIDFTEDLSALDIRRGFQNNINVFSAAKTHQQIFDMSSVVFDDEGFKRSISAFKQDASKIFGLYNDSWLRAEFDTAVLSAQGGRQWNDIQKTKDILPLLRYQTADDERVRPAHVALDNIVRPVNDPFWNTNFPPNGWRCRCDVEQLEKGEARLTPKNTLPSGDDLNPLFQNNSGKSKFIFDEKKHPYFKVDERFKAQKDDNFGFPKPERGGDA